MSTPYNDIIALNYSSAKELLKSPAHYKAYLDTPRKDTPAMRLGRLTHMALFEPAKYNASVKVGPDVDKRTKEWKDFIASVPEGAEIASPDEYEVIDDVVTSAEEGLKRLGLDGNDWQTEKAFTAEVNGITIKGRPDLVTNIGGVPVCLDLKTTEDAGPWSFSSDVNSYKYHMQAAFYMRLTGAKRFIILAVEKKPPFAYRLYELDEAAIAEGQRLMDEAVALYSVCLKINNWPSYPSDLTPLSLPKYAFNQTNQ
jgi:exodeoxyribonuclease VIII